jgi:putative N6-adenine-specific DNA methylase
VFILKKRKLLATCLFGVERILKFEILDLGYEIESVEDGRIIFTADDLGICRTNINLRTAERVFVLIDEFRAVDFEQLFDKVKKIRWEKYIEKGGAFPITKVNIVKSKINSPRSAQSICKKAIVESLKDVYKKDWIDEDGSEYPINVFIKKDIVQILLDTSGDGLHKRGYRISNHEAPIRETLACALVKMTPWNKDRILLDPFCGSGTIAIEAALMAKNIAPGINRKFVSENFKFIASKYWEEARTEAKENELDINETLIKASDISEESIEMAKDNAINADVYDLIEFEVEDMWNIKEEREYGFIVTNPPYGERLEDKKTVSTLYKNMGKVFSKLKTWSLYIITSEEEFEEIYGKKADKKRKLYNGMLRCDLYQYFGPKPKK